MKSVRVQIAYRITIFIQDLLDERNNMDEYRRIDCAIGCVKQLNSVIGTLLHEEGKKEKEDERN